MTTYIYGLQDPRNNWIRYVGKANNIQRRLLEHLNDDGNSKKALWIQNLLQLGLKPRLKILTICPIGEWQDNERNYIERYQKTLLNNTKGGNGGTYANQTSFKKGNTLWKKKKYISII